MCHTFFGAFRLELMTRCKLNPELTEKVYIERYETTEPDLI